MVSASKQQRKQVIRDAAEGHWKSILSQLGVPESFLNQSKEGPCPKCGGATRARAFDDVDRVGGVFCSHCHDSTKDGFGTLMWFHGWSFPDALDSVANVLEDWGLLKEHSELTCSVSRVPASKIPQPVNRKVTSGAKYIRDQMVWQLVLSIRLTRKEPYFSERLAEWCEVKRGLHLPTMVRCEAIRAGFHGADHVIAMLTQQSDGPITGAQYARLDGKPFSKKAKTLNHRHSVDGWFFPLGRQATLAAHTIIKCEGPLDALSICGLLPDGWAAVSTLCGAGTWPKNDVAWLKGRNVFAIGDADNVGLKGAYKFADAKPNRGLKIRVLHLPFEITPDHGKDVRDWICEGATFEDLETMISQPESIKLPVDEAEKQVPPVSNNVFPLINAIPGAEGERPEPLSLSAISKRLNDSTGGWPKVCSGRLFCYFNDADRVLFISRTPQLFAWAGRATESTGVPPNFHRMSGCHSKEEFHSHLIETQERFDSIEQVPHEPSVEGIFYAHRELPKTNGQHFNWLLSRFCVASEVDRGLIASLFLTVAWGGPAGERPIFLITADGHGAGKTTLTKIVSALFGDVIDVQPTEKLKELKERLLSPEGRKSRLSLIDNMKGFRISNAELEALITSARISGREMYVGEGSRLNLVTWMMTSNSPGLSRDLAQRVVNIQLRRSAFSASWASDTHSYVAEHRWEIIADIVSLLRLPRGKLERYSRWARWEGDILSRLPDSTNAQRVIADRQAELDCDGEESEDLELFIRAKLNELRYSETDQVFIPSSVMAKWYAEATGERCSTTKATRSVNRNIEDKLTTRLTKHRTSQAKGFIWRGDGLDEPRTDLEARISYYRVQ